MRKPYLVDEGDWYEADDVYIVYARDGYYLFNRRHPGAGFAASISM
jgi:hypothetical protein